MATLYLAAPNDSEYYMYCDAAYNYCEDRKRVGFPLYTTTPASQAVSLLEFGITAAAAFKDTTPRAFWLTPNSHTPTAYICTHRLIEPAQAHTPLIGTVQKCSTIESILPAGSSVYQLVSGSAKAWARVVVVRSADLFPKTTPV